MFTNSLPSLCPICGLRECNSHLEQRVRRFFQTEKESIEGKTMLRMKERLYLSADGKKVVKHGDPDAATLLGVAGSLISEEDAKRLGVSGDKVDETAPARFPVMAAVPGDPDDDSLYDDQSERGKEARRLAREANKAPIAEYVLSAGGSEEEAETASREATGEATPQGPTVEEQQAQNASLTGSKKK